MDKECTKCISRYVKYTCSRCGSLKMMSTVFGVDPAHLERIFRAVLGKTVKQYVDERRKKELLRILRGGGHRYGYEYANELEFSTDFAFYKWVKRVFGVTFSELRERYRRDGD